MTSRTQQHHTTSFHASITDAAKIEKIVDYSFERNEKSNVLAIHPTRPLIAYLINIQRQPKISKGWSSGNETVQSPTSSSINGQLNSSNDKIKTVSIRIIDYQTRQRCLAKGVYHARPADCVFTINSLQCTQADVIKLAVVDRLANIYLYDVSYFINDLTATRIAVIRAPGQDLSPYDSINLVWCPFVPCEDFDDGDGGLRLALATNSKIEIFAIDRIQGKTGELQRNELKGAYKCINDAHKTNIVTLSISPDCSTISAAALDNRVTFFSSDIDDSGQRCLHNWEASITDKSSISKLFFLDDYQKLLDDSTMKFWGAAFIGTKSGQMLLVDLRNWSVYQRMNINSENGTTKNFDYQIDLTSRNIIAINGNQCFVVQIEHDFAKLSTTGNPTLAAQQNEMNLIDVNNADLMNGNIFNYLLKSTSTAQQRQNQKTSSSSKKRTGSVINSTISSDGLPRIIRTTRLGLHSTIYSFVIKHKSEDELELFTISAYSLERYIINLNSINSEASEDVPTLATLASESRTSAETPHELKLFLQQFDGSLRISSSAGNIPNNTLNNSDAAALLNASAAPPITQKTPIKQQELDLFNLMNASMASQNQSNPVSAPNISATTVLPPAVPTASSVVQKANHKTNSNLNSTPPKTSELDNVDMNQMDRMVEALFTKLNTAFSQGLDEFLNDVKSEVGDLKLKLNGLCRDVRKLQQQLQEARQK